MHTIEKDDVPEVVGSTIEQLDLLIKSIGPILIENHLESLVVMINNGLNN